MRIFWKQLVLHLGTLVISFVLLGLVLAQGIRGHLTEQRMAELTTLAQRVAHSVENVVEYGIFNLQPLGIEIMNLNHYLDATVILLNTDYTVLLAHGLPDGVVAEIPFPELAPLMEGHAVTVYGTANHPALEPLLIVGYPYWFNNQVAGAALVGISMAGLEDTISAMYQVMLLALLITGAFASILIYMSSRAISRPLMQINQAATVIAAGDFDKRIPIKFHNSKNEIGQLAARFNLMAEGLQEQERIRRRFLANISHDIRSPLTSMRGFLTAIQDGTAPPTQHDYYINIVLDESERLIKLSNDILDTHQIQDSEIQLERSNFDINNVIRETILGFEGRALAKRLMITSHFAHPIDIVHADENKIRRCLYNLIDNAVKFTQEGGEIVVETSVNAEKVLLSVRDNGLGIPPEEQKHIFDRFYKGDPSRGEDKTGNGLGLSIVKSFVRAHGERITVQSTPGEGSLFTFTLDLVRSI